jgi:hypothetical protein
MQDDAAPIRRMARHSLGMAPRRYDQPSLVPSNSFRRSFESHSRGIRVPSLAEHLQLRIDTGLAIYFCDPRSPKQRGTNENTNGLLRQYFPKGTDLSDYTAADLAAVALALNSRPRNTLDWRTRAEALNELLPSTNTSPVATTG